MFYSHDLLGRKTPLGAIWTLAHGRKLPKGKIISINLREICQEILQPGVPHSLRLQGILIGGVVIVYNKQQAYLLEDLQEMMRRVKAAGKGAGPDGSAAGTTGGRNTLRKDKSQARLEAITLMDMEDLLAPTADLGLEDDFFGLLDGGFSGMNSSDASGSRGRRRREQVAGGGLSGEEVADGLFVMPSMPSTSEGGLPELSKSRSGARSVSWAAGLQNQQQEDVYGGIAHGADMNQWNPADEMFDINTDLDLLGGMDLPLQTAPETASDVGKASDSAATGTTRSTRVTAATSSMEQENPYDPTLLPDTEQHLDLMDMDMEQQHLNQDDLMSLGLNRDEAALSDSHLMTDEGRQEDSRRAGGGVVPQADKDQKQDQEAGGTRKSAARKSKKRKLGQAFVDDLDNLQIKSKEYREWVTDHSSLINLDRKNGAAQHVASTGMTNSNGMVNNMLVLNPQALLDPSALVKYPAALAAGLGATAAPGLGLDSPANIRLAPELLNLFKAPVLAASVAGMSKHIPAPSSPEVHNSTGDGVLPGNLHGEVHRDALHLRRATGAGDMDEGEEVQGQRRNLTLPDTFEMQDEHELHQMHAIDLPEGAELLSNDEAHDQLMDLPFEGEVERLRAAGPGSTHSGSLHLSSPGGSTRHTAGQWRAESDTSGSSMMLHGRRYEEVYREGGLGLRKALRMSSQDLQGMEGDAAGGMFYGAGNLEDLLPDVPMPESEAEEASPEGNDTAGAQVGSDVGRRNVSATLGTVPSSQFPLLEETEPLEATQHQQTGVFTKATQTVLSIFRQRLSSTGDTAVGQLSLFGLMKEGRLSRSEAAKLFYQVCVTTNGGFVTVKQERPFGDIAITAGRNMCQ